MPFSDTNAVRIIGLGTVTLLVAITMIGLDWEARVSASTRHQGITSNARTLIAICFASVELDCLNAFSYR